MRNIKVILLLFFCCIAARLCAADDTIGSFVTYTSANSSAGNYQNSFVVGDAAALHDNNHDNRINTTLLLTSKMNTNPSIQFYNMTVSSSASTNVELRVKVVVSTLSAGTIDQIGYRIAKDVPPTVGNFTYFNMGADFPAFQKSVEVSTNVILTPGQYFVQWFARETTNSDGNTNTYSILIGQTDNNITIIQPRGVSGKRPVIEAVIVSQSGISQANFVTINMYSGDTAIGTPINTRIADNTIFDIHTGKLNYVYGGADLTPGQTYTVEIIFNDSGAGNTFRETSGFEVSSEPISNLKPYPSPYNPNRGQMNIDFVIDQQSSVSINIYDRAGKLVSKVISSQQRPAGNNSVQWEGKSYAGDRLANGIYICEIIANSGGKENRRYKSFAILRK
ncbi:MAG: T9SS type A sorting domain-containing protein [Endomicrobia bacterium]|nr:T9SS type A sorting domain-containing protein [Endomicrobiia bacterium]